MNRSRRVAVAFAIDLGIVVGELVGGVTAHSTSLLADAGHNLADAVGLLIALVAVRLTTRAPTTARTFGLHRATILSAFTNAGVVLAVTALVAAEAISRILHPVRVDGLAVALVASAALAANATAAVVLAGDGSKDLNITSATLHFIGDSVASLGVIIAGAVIAATGRFAVLDPAISLGIAGVIAWTGWRIGRKSVEILLEASPADLDLSAVGLAMATVPGVAEVHDVHCWSLSSEIRALSAHLVLSGHPTLEQAQVVAGQVRAAIGEPFHIAHTTLELECERCVDDATATCSIEGAQPDGVRAKWTTVAGTPSRPGV